MKTVNPKFLAVFLPGMPGAKKEFRIFDDIRSRGGEIKWLTYTGTYDNIDSGIFSVSQAKKDIKTLLEKLADEHKNVPILLMAYSFSTILLNEIDLSKYNIISVVLFSPVKGFDDTSINGENFIDTLRELKENNFVNLNYATWHKTIAKKAITFDNYLRKYLALKVPLAIAFSTKDNLIFPDKLAAAIHNIKTAETQNAIFALARPFGFHKIDSYYDDTIADYIKTLEI